MLRNTCILRKYGHCVRPFRGHLSESAQAKFWLETLTTALLARALQVPRPALGHLQRTCSSSKARQTVNTSLSISNEIACYTMQGSIHGLQATKPFTGLVTENLRLLLRQQNADYHQTSTWKQGGATSWRTKADVPKHRKMHTNYDAHAARPAQVNHENV